MGSKVFSSALVFPDSRFIPLQTEQQCILEWDFLDWNSVYEILGQVKRKQNRTEILLQQRKLPQDVAASRNASA